MATQYVVLEKDGPTGWTVAGTVDSHGSEAAVRKLAQERKEGGTYVAVPARSFQPVRISFEQIPRTVVSVVKHDFAQPKETVAA